MYLLASPTVLIFSAASSGISTPNSSSKAITSSTMSRLSAPRSSMKLASGVTLSSSTPRCSTTIFLTRSAVSLICCPLEFGGLDLAFALMNAARGGKCHGNCLGPPGRMQPLPILAGLFAGLLGFRRLDRADVQFAQLLQADWRRRAHHQVLR